MSFIKNLIHASGWEKMSCSLRFALVRIIVEKNDPDTNFENSGNVDDLHFSVSAAPLNLYST